jgi:phosphate transport system substrate-binding protein
MKPHKTFNKKNIFQTVLMAIYTVLALITLSACGVNANVKRAPGNPPVFSPPTFLNTPINNLLGAGESPFDRLGYKWFGDYQTGTGIKTCYQPIGISQCLNALNTGSANFLVTNGILTPDQLKTVQGTGGTILYIPEAIDIVAIACNLPSLNQNRLKLTGTILADVYMGKITKWNDPAIAALNTGVVLPDSKIIAVYDNNQSGTNNIFSEFLAGISPAWKTKYGVSSWTGSWGSVGASGDEGAARLVSQTPNSIGYMELGEAKKYQLGVADLQNSNGNYITPTPDSSAKSAAGMTIPNSTIVSISGGVQPDAYPLTGFVWSLVYQNQKDSNIGKSLVDMLWWSVHDGQQSCAGLDYGALPPTVVAKAETLISSINYQGTPLRN